MPSLVNEVLISENEKTFFHDHGFIRLKQLLTLDAIDGLQALTRNSQQMKRPPDFYSGELSKIGYDIDGDIIRNIYLSKNFQKALNTVADQELTFMQGIGFEIETNQKGFPWHNDIYSFCYTMPEDFGYTLWVPLIPIHTQEQHGGMAYASRQVHSAREQFKLVYSLIKSKNFSNLQHSKSLHEINFQYASKLETLVLENNKVEDDFELGDVLLLDKTIWHRSCPLKEGVLPSRMAYVMRFISSQARYSKASIEGTYLLLDATGKDVQSDFGYRLDKILRDGDIISEKLQNPIMKN